MGGLGGWGPVGRIKPNHRAEEYQVGFEQQSTQSVYNAEYTQWGNARDMLEQQVSQKRGISEALLRSGLCALGSMEEDS
jgi:hypothetical protein